MYNKEREKKNERRNKDSSTLIPAFVRTFIKGNTCSFYRRAFEFGWLLAGVNDP